MIKCDKCGENMIVDTRVVLTSIPPMYECYCPKCGNRKYAYCSECSENEKIDFDGYVGIGFNATGRKKMNLIDADELMESLDPKESVWVGLVLSELIANAPTVEAIPKEWIRDYMLKLPDGSAAYECILVMLENWEKENANK